jgi:hypothetical protein
MQLYMPFSPQTQDLFIYFFWLNEFTWNSLLDAQESMVYSYTKGFNAFAAKLSQDEAQKLLGTYVN